MKSKNKILILLFSFGLIVDQLTKYYISNYMELYESIPIIPDFFNITYVQNTGAAFSILEGRMMFFYIVSIIGLVVLSFFYKTLHEYQFIAKIGVVLMFVGTIGNFIDRLVFQYVIDFLDFIIFGFDFAVFNVADSCLVLGIIIVFVDELLTEFGVTYGKKIHD